MSGAIGAVVRIFYRCPLWLEMLEKLENESFSEFCWKSWKIEGFSPALAGKAEFFGPNNNLQHYYMKSELIEKQD